MKIENLIPQVGHEVYGGTMEEVRQAAGSGNSVADAIEGWGPVRAVFVSA